MKKKQKKRIEELLVDNRQRFIRGRGMRFIEQYVHVIEETAGIGKVLRDFYAKPSAAKEDAYRLCKNLTVVYHGILGTVVNGGVSSFSYGYLVYGKGVQQGGGKEDADKFYLRYKTAWSSHEIEFPSEYIYKWFHQYVHARGQIIDCLHYRIGYEIEIELE